jgi:hypothetical protein
MNKKKYSIQLEMTIKSNENPVMIISSILIKDKRVKEADIITAIEIKRKREISNDKIHC